MKMPLSEIADRYTISLLRQELTNIDVSEEISEYKKELDKYENLSSLIDELYYYNRKIWTEESEAHRDFNLDHYTASDYEKIGKLSISIRDSNNKRNLIKSKISNFAKTNNNEILINYKKVNYGQEM